MRAAFQLSSIMSVPRSVSIKVVWQHEKYVEARNSFEKVKFFSCIRKAAVHGLDIVSRRSPYCAPVFNFNFTLLAPILPLISGFGRRLNYFSVAILS
jgi:hypothetical protein